MSSKGKNEFENVKQQKNVKSGVQSLEFYITGAELQTERTQGAGFFYLHHALPEKRDSAQLPPSGEIWIIRLRMLSC